MTKTLIAATALFATTAAAGDLNYQEWDLGPNTKQYTGDITGYRYQWGNGEVEYDIHFRDDDSYRPDPELERSYQSLHDAYERSNQYWLDYMTRD